MKYIGAHVDSLPSVAVAPEQAHLLGAKAFAFNLIDPTRFRSPAYDRVDITAFRDLCNNYGFEAQHSILPHSAFTVNLGSPDARKLNLSRLTFVDEMNRCNQLGIKLLNLHPGSHLRKISEQDCLKIIAESLNYCLAKVDSVIAVLENTAGQGSAVGYRLEHLAEIIDLVEDKSRVGICIDTCHAMAAGYNLSSDYESFVHLIDSIVGLKFLRGMHLNDCQRECGSHIDRHAPLGHGSIGKEFFINLMADPRMDGIPMILETDPENWTREIAWLYSLPGAM